MADVGMALAKVTQLPVIEDQLSSVLPGIKERCDLAASLVVDEGNYKEMKKIRADLNKEYGEFKKLVKEIEATIKAPFEEFRNGICKEVEQAYINGISALDVNIKDTEGNLKEIRLEDVRKYFKDYEESIGLDFVTFDRLGVKVGLSGSLKALKQEVKDRLDKISSELQMIETLENREEILVEYRESLNASEAVRIVADRKKRIEEEIKRREMEEEFRKEREWRESMLNEVLEKEDSEEELPSPEVKIAVEQEEAASEKICNTSYLGYSIYGTKEQLKALKAYLVEALVEYLEKEGMTYGKQ